MAPLPATVEVKKESLHQVGSRDSVPIFGSMPYLVLGLGAFSLAVCLILYFIRTRRGLHDSHDMDGHMEYLILESEVSIEIGDDHFEFEYDDNDTDYDVRQSFETIVDGTTPLRMAFDINKLPHIKMGARTGGNLLERRGKRTLIIRPNENSEADMALVDFQNGKLIVSPFVSRKEVPLNGMDFPTRRRTPRFADTTTPHTSGLATAPHNLQSHWRPLDPSSPSDKK